MPRALLIAALALGLAAPCAGSAEEPARRVLDWESGANKSYLIPALEIPTFVFLLNRANARP